MDKTLVKKFLRIDIDDDDDYVELLIKVARDYIIGAIGKCDENNPRVKLLMLNIIANLYETRQYTIDKNNEKVQYALHSMMLQLQLEELTKESSGPDG